VTGSPATACPRCGAPLAATQEWCLRCGAAARTRLVPTPGWRVPVVVVAVVVTACIVALAWAFVAITSDQGPSTGDGDAQQEQQQTAPAASP
jgi:hypothetical protein